jgi:hypothetical protein
VAIVQKSDGMLTWRMDLEDAFCEVGAVTQVSNFRPESLPERWCQRTTGKRLLHNPATCRRIAESLAGFAPDLVLVLNFPGLPAATAAALRAALRPGVPVVGWLCDQLDEFPAACDPVFDGVYYFDSACLPVLEEAYAGSSARLKFLPLAACPRRYPCRPIEIRQRTPGLVFAGNCTPSRQPFFAEIRHLGQRLDLYGPHAGNWPRFWRNRRLSSAALGRVYQQYRVNLNLLQPGNTTHGLNLRAFEIPCAGGLATYPEVPDLPRCFVPDREVLAYRSARHLAEIVAAVHHDPDFALAVTTAGHQRVLREHTFRHRVERILAEWNPPTQPATP